LSSNVSASSRPSLDNACVNRFPIADICCEKDRRAALGSDDTAAMVVLSSEVMVELVGLYSEQRVGCVEMRRTCAIVRNFVYPCKPSESPPQPAVTVPGPDLHRHYMAISSMMIHPAAATQPYPAILCVGTPSKRVQQTTLVAVIATTDGLFRATLRAFTECHRRSSGVTGPRPSIHNTFIPVPRCVRRCNNLQVDRSDLART
jgi:hypothetical protein